MLRNIRKIDGERVYNTELKGEPLRLPLLSDSEMVEMMEKSIRGGISQVGQLRYAEADNGHQLMYVDANNLYGWAMSQALPIGGFKWLDVNALLTKLGAKRTKRRRKIELTNCRIIPDKESGLSRLELLDGTVVYDPNGNVGYKFEVDLVCPPEAQDRLRDLPGAPENVLVEREWLAELQQTELDRRKHWTSDPMTKQKRSSVPKLCTTFFDKVNYVCEIENLLCYLRLGYHLMKVHRVLQYDQEKWLKPYIEFNTNLRAVAKTDFERDYYKLMNNSVFGKTMENVRKHKDIRFYHPDEMPKHDSPRLHT